MTENNASKFWYDEEWARQLFVDEPALMSMSMRLHEVDSGFGYNYCACILFEGKIKHRWYTLDQASSFHIKETFKRLLEDRADSRWLDGVPEVSMIKHVINRARLGLESPVALEYKVETREKILEEHGEMMLCIFRRFANLLHIGKRRNAIVSPRTFMFIRKNTEAESVVTWMADPSVHRMLDRVRTRHRWEHYDGPGSKDALDCSHIFTRADVFTHFGVADSRAMEGPSMEDLRKMTLDELAQQGRFILRAAAVGSLTAEEIPHLDNAQLAARIYDRLHPSEPHVVSAPAEQAPVEAPSCTKCGISFATNVQFGTGDEKLCGECELKQDSPAGYGVSAQARKVYLQPPKQPSKYDARPGIDDQGLGFYSPSWED